MDMADQLQKLNVLHGQGALTDEEFSLAKKKLIDGVGINECRAPLASNKANTGNSAASGTSALHQLHRSRDDRWIVGVCGGLAEFSNIPAWSWRLLFVLLTVLHGFGVLAYILLWIFVPIEITPVLPTAAVQAAESEVK